MTYSTSEHCTGWNNCPWLKQTPSRLDVLFLRSIFRLYSGFEMSFEHNSVRKNVFLTAGSCWESKLPLREMDQKFKFVGTIGYGDSCLEFLFRHFKVFRLHAILHDAAGAVQAYSGQGSGFCYIIGRGSRSCLLGHLTGLLFSLHLKLFLPSTFNSVDFWGSMSCIVVNIELADKNVIRELGVSIDAIVHGCSFRPPKEFKPTK